ncbi:MAG: carbohydrate ABC transporter permease [Clostridiaceae bacterium]|nr:carbohydrate ABC transporter permease [Clostridiaceae bacterium]
MKIGSLGVDIILYVVVGLFALACLYPFVYVLSSSITPYEDYLKAPMSIIPRNVILDAYYSVLSFPLIQSGYKVTVFVTILGTFINLLLLITSAYPLSKKDLKGRRIILGFIIFTMFFNGGLIPNYYLVRSLKLLNSVWALILPGAISPFNLILMKSFISQIPDSLEESAVIDGANEIRILANIIIPLSTPAIATFALFHAVGHWNSFFSAVIYLNKRSSWPLMLVLRELVIENAVFEVGQIGVDLTVVTPFTIKMATIAVAIIPIMLVYPFLQRFFMKGLLLGAIKG